MKIYLQSLILPLSLIVSLTACGVKATEEMNKPSVGEATKGESKNTNAANETSNTNGANTENFLANQNSIAAQTKQPKTVLEFFKLLPQKYFTLEGCADNPTAKNCDRARTEYLESYLEVEDVANGYLKTGCDGAQSCLQMALFKRGDADYLVGLEGSNEETTQNYFLEYKNGEWKDVGASVVPQFSEKNIYEIPRYGTIVKVYSRRKISEVGENEKGAKIYDLVWKNGKFAIPK